ncbi:SpaH/EbpB family LPXTG-anchored major pilin [Bifidobacterium sp. CP2]|uniref:SpaH/EbpB family LPXTG-anchored major pilin n=1 Tax=Bifidobacterium sp. CP2 TaxID=2809025 RepID=UPI001BDBB5C4|nr:SpaH/EbpB family LPXTG-anchored major pilin [Bifidobacterium sp. CP2]MBT1181741.1 SpaH/EbpB family LPXTG-anchored major pilin [Bifidobacterium sp. CP2]
MTIKQLFAGVAAAATLLGGFALGAATANAAEASADALAASDGVITLSGEGVNERSFKAVRIGSYVSASLSDKQANLVNSVEVGTVDDAKGVLETALNAVDKDAYEASVYGKAGNPAGYVAANMNDSNAEPWDGALRKFVTRLAAEDAFKTLVEKSTLTATGKDGTAKFEKLPEGLYVVVDATEGQSGDANYGPSIPMVVATAVAGRSLLGLDGQKLGEVDVKNQPNQAPTKTVTGDTEGTVNVGDQLTYTVKGEIPSTVGHDKFSYQFKDYPGKGLTVEDISTNVKVYVAGKDGTYPADPLSADEVETGSWNDVDRVVGSDDGSRYFTVTVSDVSAYSNRKIKMVYTATVNQDAVDTVSNKATVSPNGQGESKPGEKKLKTYGFQFTKTDADGNNLKGAEFTITNQDGKYISQQERGGLSDDAEYWNADQTNGVFTVTGLKAGTYTVTETKTPEGFMTAVKAKFTVTIDKDGNVSYQENGMFGLVSGDASAIKVKNVKNVTELPKTGAAGIALFVVLAGLLAGAAATVFAKSRATKRALEA